MIELETNAGVVETQWNAMLERHYCARPLAPYASIDSLLQEDVSRFLKLQIATHLEALGYIQELDSESAIPEDPVLWDAFNEWRSDYMKDQVRADRVQVERVEDEKLEQTAEREREIRYLKAQCTFEGETKIGEALDSDRGELAQRIARYRKRVFGLTETDRPVEGAGRAAWEEAKEALCWEESEAFTFIDLLGDAPELTSRFAQAMRDQAFRFANAPESTASAPFRIERGSSQGYRRQGFRQASFGRSRAPKVRRARPVRAAVQRNPPSLLRPSLVAAGRKASSMASPAMNRFGLRLLQVRLWMFGYYRGEVDGAWGPMIAGALARFVAEHREGSRQEERLADPKRWLRLDEDQCAVDLCYLFSFIVERLDAAAEMTDREHLDQLLELSLGEGEEGLNQELEAEVSEAEEGISAELLEANERRKDEQSVDRAKADRRLALEKNPRRRRYFGWRPFFAMIGRAICWVGKTVRRAVEWIRFKIREVVQYATTVINYLREKTRRAVRLAGLGLQRLRQWIFAEPVVTRSENAVVATLFARDFDAVVLASGSADAALLSRHQDALDALRLGFGFLLEVGMEVWGILRAVAFRFANWLLLTWRSYKAIRRILKSLESYSHLLDRLAPAVY